MKISIHLFWLFLFGASCSGQESKVHPNSIGDADTSIIKLNNVAMTIFQNNSGDVDSVLKAIDLLSEVIKKDKYYPLAYSNKASLLCHIGNLTAAIALLDEASVVNPTITGLKLLKGFMLERSGKKDMAMDVYKIVLKEYDESLRDSVSVALRIDRAFLFFFIDGYDRGIREFNLIQNEYPNNVQVKAMQVFFVSFDRKTYINSICKNGALGE